MSRDDFCRCTPSEFSTIVSRWRELREADSREAWERGRFMASVMLQPWSKKSLKPRDICTFPWEKEEEAGTSSKEMFEGLLKRLGRR